MGRRRHFARSLVPLGVFLIIAGVFIASQASGLLSILGFLVLMQGVGLTAAALPLLFGHNPLDKS